MLHYPSLVCVQLHVRKAHGPPAIGYVHLGGNLPPTARDGYAVHGKRARVSSRRNGRENARLPWFLESETEAYSAAAHDQRKTDGNTRGPLTTVRDYFRSRRIPSFDPSPGYLYRTLQLRRAESTANYSRGISSTPFRFRRELVTGSAILVHIRANSNRRTTLLSRVDFRKNRLVGRSDNGWTNVAVDLGAVQRENDFELEKRADQSWRGTFVKQIKRFWAVV